MEEINDTDDDTAEKDSDDEDSAQVGVRIQTHKRKLNHQSITIIITAAVRSRAFHRRAKARLALGDSIGALDDANGFLSIDVER